MNLASVHYLDSPNIEQSWKSAFLASLDKQDKRMQVVVGDHVEGSLTKARFAALAKQDTEWVGWVDPDDLVPAGSFKMLIAQLKPGVGLVTGDELTINTNGDIRGRCALFGKNVTQADIERSPMTAHKGLIHRSALPIARDIIGDCNHAVDWALMLAATLVGDVIKIPKVTYNWRHHPNQMHRHTTDDYENIKARYFAIKAKMH